MDLAHGIRRLCVIIDHTNKDGRPKLLKRCRLPRTGGGCETTVYPSLAVIDIVASCFVLREKLAGISFGELQR